MSGISLLLQISYAKEASYPLVTQISASSTINKLNIQNDNVSSIAPFLVIVYHKTGGLIGSDEKFIYNSFTKEMNYFNNRGIEFSKVLSDQQERSLKEILTNNTFFEAESFYPPIDSGAADFFEYTLIATIDGKINAVYWTDVSEDMPRQLWNIVNNIEYYLR